jgi:hypothetical protein
VQIYGSFIEVQVRSIAPKKRRRPSEIRIAQSISQVVEPPMQLEPESFPFDFPIQLDWPTPLELSPMNVSLTNQAALLPNHTADAIDYIELTEISINKKTFVIEPLYPIRGNDRRGFRMYCDKEYMPVHVKSEGVQAALVNSYLLVQKQVQPDHERGVVVIENPEASGARAFRYEAEKDPFVPLRIIGPEREWSFQDDEETSGSEHREPHIIGEVVAWLRLHA